MDPNQKPSVGDTLRMLPEDPAYAKFTTSHGAPGEVFRVVKVDEFDVWLDHCTCRGSVDGHIDFKWTWATYSYKFEWYISITSEEADRAHKMPSPDDVAQLLGLKRNV